MTAWPPCAVAEILFVIIAGLALGSFATALAWRVPRCVSWIAGKSGMARSRCPSCSERLRARDLIPVFSWLLQRGRCRYCGASIPVRYPLTELAILIACLAVYSQWGLGAQGLLIICCLPFLAALFLVDMESLILPDQLTLTCFIIGLAFITARIPGEGTEEIFLTHIVGGAVLYAGFAWLLGIAVKAVLKKEALGFGDVKFFAVAGLWLGISYFPVFLILSGFIGLIWGILWKAIKKNALFPFGPALILTFYFCLLLQKAGSESIFWL